MLKEQFTGQGRVVLLAGGGRSGIRFLSVRGRGLFPRHRGAACEEAHGFLPY